mmetsp:Transcript_18914/g.26623  ORF Transcript_18914/g.26623 Transcript_18914/m.26623 type:complete len:357 (+) Transcript_18914:232-1302(+)
MQHQLPQQRKNVGPPGGMPISQPQNNLRHQQDRHPGVQHRFQHTGRGRDETKQQQNPAKEARRANQFSAREWKAKMETVTTQTVHAIMTLRKDSLAREKRVSSLEMRGLGQGHVTNQQLQGMIIQLQRRNEINEQMIITLRRQNQDMGAKMQQLQLVVRELRAERDARPPRTPQEGGRGVAPVVPSNGSSASNTRQTATSLASQNPFLTPSVGGAAAAAQAVHASPSPSFETKVGGGVGGGEGGEKPRPAPPVDIFSTGGAKPQHSLPPPAAADSTNIFAQVSTGVDHLSLHQALAGSGGDDSSGGTEANIFLTTGFTVPSRGGVAGATGATMPRYSSIVPGQSMGSAGSNSVQGQ